MNLGYKKHVDDILFDHGRKCGHSCVWIHVVGKSSKNDYLVCWLFVRSFLRPFTRPLNGIIKSSWLVDWFVSVVIPG